MQQLQLELEVNFTQASTSILHGIDAKECSSPHLNLLVGRDGAAKSDKCSDQYISSWGPLHVGS